MRLKFASVVLLSSLWIVALTAATRAQPVGGTIDPLIADQSEQAVKFRAAVAAAQAEDGKLDPLPQGISGERQRLNTINAYEAAIAIMPHSLWCPEMLARVAYLWSSPAVAPEQPNKALAAYQRLQHDYPDAAKYVVIGMCGEAGAYEAMQQPDHADERWNAVLKFQLPAGAAADAVKELAEAKATADLHLHPIQLLPDGTTRPATRPSGAGDA